MSDVKTETIPAATETGAQDANDAMTEVIPAATETGAQDGSDAMTEAIPSVNEAGALAESAEIIWTGPHPAIAESAEVVWSPATMVELAPATADAGPAAETVSAGDTAQFIVTAGPPETVTGSEAAQAAGSTPATQAAQAAGGTLATQTAQAARRSRGRHAAPRTAGTRPSTVGLAKRGEGRHAAARPAGGVARRLAISAGSAAMVAVGLHAVAS
jgi:hypothetical protein